MTSSDLNPDDRSSRRRASLPKDFAVSQIENIVKWQQAFDWLTRLGVVAPRGAHFGCGTGEGTLGLIGAVQADLASGVDRDPELLLEARDRLLRLKWDLTAFWTRLKDSDSLPVREFSWWNRDVPRYLKDRLLDEDFMVDFHKGYLPGADPLEESGIDLVLSYFQLCNIWWDRQADDPEHETRVAIGKLKNNLRQGGYLAVVEWCYKRYQPELDFPRLFEQLDLRLVFEEKIPIDEGHSKGVAARYLCQKSV